MRVNVTTKSNVPKKLYEKNSISFWGSVTLIFCFLIFSPFNRALFNGSQSTFDAPIFTFQAITALALIGICIFMFFQKGSPSSRQGVLQHLIWLIPTVYLISTISAASAFNSTFSFWIQLTNAILFIVGLHLSNSIYGSRIVSSCVIVPFYLVTIFGLMNWFGDASLWGVLDWGHISAATPNIYLHAVMIDANGERLTSVFQYANTYSAFLIAAIVIFAIQWSGSKNKLASTLASLMLVPAIVSFFLTLSRGGLVVFPIIFGLVLPLMRISKQVIVIIQLGIAITASVLILNPTTQYGLDLQGQFSSSKALEAWSLLLAVASGVAFLGWVISRWGAPWVESKLRVFENKKFSSFAIPVTGVVLGVLAITLLLGNSGVSKLLPENIQNRIENINLNQHSVLERGTFYQDALKLWKDYPVFGAGGGAWQSLYEKYQNNPYTSRQAHNFFLQTLVEVGLVGTLMLLFIIGVVFYHFLRSFWKKTDESRYPNLIFYTIVVAILIHSIIDFNMSYIFLSSLVYLCLGGMLAANELPPFTFQKQNNKIRILYPFALVIGAVVIIVNSINNLGSNSLYQQAIANAREGKSIEEVLPLLDQAIQKMPHPEYVVSKVQILGSLYDQTKDQQYVEEARRALEDIKIKEPFNKSFVLHEVRLDILEENYENARNLLVSAIPNFPWEIKLYEELASVFYHQGYKQLEQGNIQEAKALWDESFKVFETVQTKAEYLGTLPEAQLQGREFGLTPNLALPLGIISYYRGDYADAEQYLRLRLDMNFNDPKDLEASIYYLATIQRQNKTDDGMANALFQKYSDQKELIEQDLNRVLSLNPVQ